MRNVQNRSTSAINDVHDDEVNIGTRYIPYDDNDDCLVSSSRPPMGENEATDGCTHEGADNNDACSRDILKSPSLNYYRFHQYNIRDGSSMMIN